MPNWEDFKRKHILNPAEAPNWESWNRAQWNTWFQNRLPSDFGRKRVNSVVVSSPDDIVKDFQTLNHGVCAIECCLCFLLHLLFFQTCPPHSLQKIISTGATISIEFLDQLSIIGCQQTLHIVSITLVTCTFWLSYQEIRMFRSILRPKTSSARSQAVLMLIFRITLWFQIKILTFDRIKFLVNKQEFLSLVSIHILMGACNKELKIAC